MYPPPLLSIVKAVRFAIVIAVPPEIDWTLAIPKKKGFNTSHDRIDSQPRLTAGLQALWILNHGLRMSRPRCENLSK